MSMAVVQFEISMRIVTIVAPVAMYFMLLGLLNTRRNPQLLTGLQDFAMMTVVMSPLALQPVVYYLGSGLGVILASAAVLVGGVFLLAPRGRSWVIYNLPLKRTQAIVLDSLEAIGLPSQATPAGVELPQGLGLVQFDSFPFLRNCSLRLVDGQAEIWNDFEVALARRLSEVEVEATPLAVTLLLLATGMIVAPMVLMINHAPQIVRILSDLLQ